MTVKHDICTMGCNTANREHGGLHVVIQVNATVHRQVAC